ncbi:GNAT family N-acetyltransferase [Deinococcus altitudinis]|uniref:GNAT family N-acetyltransferase n=1 Tax=Deinococcus altitudinis TaxID=468914 RepID=UPI003891BEF3
MLNCLNTAPQSRAAWLAVWQRTGREPFAHPEYLLLFTGQHEEAQALHWTDGDSGAEVLLPLIRRPLDKALQPAAVGWTDAISPYGYGGPFAAPGADIPWERFWQDILAWMVREQVLTLFVRASLSPTPPLDLTLPAGQSYASLHLNDNVVVDMRRTPEDQWQHYDHKVRKNVKKARRADLIAEVRDDFSSVSDFVEIYSGTMQRRSASDWYYFGQDFFQGFSDHLKGSYLVAEVGDAAGTLISVELILKSDRFLYSFLGGTRQEAFAHAPNDLLKDAAIQYGHNSGLQGYVLGGGHQRDDGIFRYKRAFDSDGVTAFYGLQLVADQMLLRSLTAVHHDQADGAETEVETNFFPAYRSPLATAASKRM